MNYWMKTQTNCEIATKHVCNTKICEIRSTCRGFSFSFTLLHKTDFLCFVFRSRNSNFVKHKEFSHEKVIEITSLKLGLHIRASGKLNSEANNERPDYILASWCASSFVLLLLKVVFLTLVKRHADVYTNLKWFGAHTSTDMWMFVRVCKRFIRIATATCKCSCKWQTESQTWMRKWGITIARENSADCETWAGSSHVRTFLVR